MEVALDRADLRRRLDARVARRVVPLLTALAAAFAFYALVTFLFPPPRAGLAIGALDLGCALLLGASAFALRGRALHGRGNMIAALALLVGLTASLFVIKVLELPVQTSNVMVVIFGGSMILLSAGWTTALLAASLLGWTLVAWTEGLGDEWLAPAFGLVATCIVGTLVQFVRLRDARATEELALANEDKALRLERAFEAERSNARTLATANDSLEAFTYVVSHDLKEPIRGMRALLEELQDELDAPREERAAAVAAALKSEAHLERLVQGLLEWSRASMAPLEPEPVDVAELLDDPATRAVYERVFHERRVKLLLEREIPLVLGTPPLLRQVLGNLLLNAAKHNPRADPQVRVYAASDAPRGMVDLIVEDNGPGYPDAVLARMRGLKDRPSSVRGGFGLAIAKRAAQRMGGDLTLTNRDEGGSRAHVILPAAGALDADVRLAEAPSPRAPDGLRG